MRTQAIVRAVPVLLLSTLGLSSSGGCGSSNAAGPSAQVLDPTQQHYGNTDDEWGALWWKWIYELPQTAGNCIIPFQDPTGANCGYGQSGPVFYLAGTVSGTAVRNQCVVPLGKAIFFPILTFTADNAGVPVASQLTPQGLSAGIKTQLDGVPISSLSAEFDGLPITDLGRFRTAITMFSYTLPPEPNSYTCEGATGVTGTISPAFAGGFYVMLPPPAAGTHALHFAGRSPASSPAFSLDVTYDFKVQ
jgi:hypothetical protein